MVEKTVRVRFVTDGSDGVKRDMTDITRKGDDLNKKRITPKLSVDGLKQATLGMDKISVGMDKLSHKISTPKITVDGIRAATLGVDKISLGIEKLSKKIATPKVSLQDNQFKTTMDEVLARLELFSRKKAAAEADVKDELAKEKLLKLEVKMNKLSRQTAKPDIDLLGAKSALAQMMAVNREIDKLSHKSARISVTETENKSSFDRIKKAIASFGGGGGDSGPGGLIPKLFSGGGSAGGGAASAGGSAAAGGGSMLNLAPFGGVSAAGGVGIAALGAWAASLMPALATLGVALGPALGGGILAGLSGKNSKGKMTGPLVEFAKDMLGVFREAVAPISKVLPGMLSNLGAVIRSLPLKKMFADSIPVLRMFMNLVGNVAKALMPMFIQSLKSIKPVLPIMEHGLMMIVRALTDFIRNLGPGIKPSASIFLATAKLLDWTMRALGVICSFLAKTFVDTAHAMAAAWRWFSHEFLNGGEVLKQVGHLFMDMMRGMKEFGLAMWHGMDKDAHTFWHALVGVYGDIKNGVTSAWHSCFMAVKNFGMSVWHDLSNEARNFWHDLVNNFNAIKNGVLNAWNNCFNSVRNFFHSVTTEVSGWARSFWHDLVNIWNTIKSDVTHAWESLWNWASNRFHTFSSFASSVASNFWGELKHIWNSIKTDITNIWDSLWNWAGNKFHSLTTGIENLATGMWHGVSRTFHSLDNDIRSIFGGTWTAIKRLADNGVGWVIDAINGLGSAWNKVAGFLHLPQVPHMNTPKFADGGNVGYRVGGSGRGDKIPALLEPTETVIPARVANKYAYQLKMDGIPGYQRGGIVGADGMRRFATGGNAGGGPPHPTVPHPGVGNPGNFQRALHGSGDNPFGGLISDLASLGRKALVAPAVAAIKGAEGLVNHISFQPVKDIFMTIGNEMISKLEGAIAKKEASAAGGGSGVIPAWFKKTFKNDPYHWGGNSTTAGADCSGATLLTYKHFGIANGMPRTSQTQYGWSNRIANATPGALVFLQGSDGTNDRSGAGHVGIAVDGKNYMSEFDTQVGFRQGPYDGPHTFGLPHGWDLKRFNAKFNTLTGIHTGSMLADGRTVYGYLMNSIFHDDKIASAGALASMWGESQWNPESAGTGGWGLMGWTGNFKDRRSGNAQRDMKMELPLIAQYIRTFGKEGAIREMMHSRTVADAANIWGPKVEAFGINDVHSEGISLAKRIAGLANGGWINEPMIAMGLNSGNLTRLGEHEAEYVTPASKMGSGGGGGAVCVNVYCHPSNNPDDTAKQVVQMLRDYKRHRGGQATGIG